MHLGRFRARLLSAMGLGAIALSVEDCASNDAAAPPTAVPAAPAPTVTAAPAEPAPAMATAAPAPAPAPVQMDASTSEAVPIASAVAAAPASTDAGAPGTKPKPKPRPKPSASAIAMWSATYNRPEQPAHCRTGYAQCFPADTLTEITWNHPASTAARGCPSAIDVPCECSPHDGCFVQTMCVAPLHAQVTREQRAAKPGACCFAAPQRCPAPGEGRALRVAGVQRVADTIERSDWLMPDVVVAPVDDASAVERWSSRAAGEHASIASFARVALELMALGAPADLVARTHRAAMDEIDHARIAYSVASALAGKTVGPGPLATAEHRDVTFASVARDTFLDACVDETIGALALRDEAASCADPGLASLLDRIAEEEAAHAELAWATLAWLVRRGGDEARAAVESAAATLDEAAPALREIVMPCLAALLASPGPSLSPYTTRLARSGRGPSRSRPS